MSDNRTVERRGLVFVWGVAAALAGCAHAQAPPPVAAFAPPAAETCDGGLCRPPRTDRIVLPGGRAVEAQPPPSYFFAPDVLRVLPGDDFFVTGTERDGGLFDLHVVPPPPAPAAHVLHVKLAQEEIDPGHRVMMLTLTNHFAGRLVYRAAMSTSFDAPTPPTELKRTSTCPVRPGLNTIEMWPHPVSALALSSFHFDDHASKCREY